MHTGLRAAIIVVSVFNALLPAATGFVTLVWIDWSFALAVAVAFIALLTPHATVMITARYEPVSWRGLTVLLACVLVFGLVPAIGLSVLLVTVGGAGFGWMIIAACGAFVLLLQLVVYHIAVRAVRGPKPTVRIPEPLKWI
jgi:hypothetical protein